MAVALAGHARQPGVRLDLGDRSFDGIIDGGTSRFAAAHGSFHAATLPNGDMRITAVINAG
jgi:hypothetical protein